MVVAKVCTKEMEREILKLIETGLPLKSLSPYSELASRAGIEEKFLLDEIARLIAEKKIKRFGAVIYNHSIGLNQNAMVTLKVAPEKIVDAGSKISEFDFVTLCYERAPVKNVWDYNLYFMIHGRDRSVVEKQISTVLDAVEIPRSDCQILFSLRAFKQQGAKY